MSIQHSDGRGPFDGDKTPGDDVENEHFSRGLEMTDLSRNGESGKLAHQAHLGSDESITCDDDDGDEVICSTSLLRITSMWNNDHSLEEGVRIKWRGSTRKSEVHENAKGEMQAQYSVEDIIGRNEIVVSTLLEPDDIAPLFSGAEWAGTRVWDAALDCVHYLYDRLKTEQGYSDKSSQKMLQGCTVLELGCGLGVPGMIFSMGMDAKHVVLTDQEQILNQLTKNVQSNFVNSDNRKIEARALFWSKENIRALLKDVGLECQGFDFVINCDCVYEPLYGTSWKALVECIDELLRIRPTTIVLSSCERRNHDGVDDFIKAIELCEHVKAVVRVFVKDNVEIYETIGMYDIG